MVSFDSKKYSKKLLLLISWSHWFTFFNIIAAIALSSYYLFSETSPDTLLGQAYLVTTWLSHMAFLTFMSFVLILFPMILIFPNTKFIRISASLIYTFGLLLLLLDGFIYSRLGYHLNASSSAQIFSLIAEQIKPDKHTFWIIALILCVVILAFEFVVSNYAWKHLKQLQKTVFARFVIFALVFSFFFSHLSHIWADANLDYDILRQDTVLPLSYPLTAKTLLTKYGMFNLNDYMERKTSSLIFTETIPQYPQLTQQCESTVSSKQSVFIVLTEDLLTENQIKQFDQRTPESTLKLDHNIDTALKDDAWFNLFYGLPTIYQDEILAQQSKPLLFQALEQHDIPTSFTLIGDDIQEKDEPFWVDSLFNNKIELANISSLVFEDKLNNIAPGMHLIYFSKDNQYQFELFMDALLLAQKHKTEGDIIWVSSIGNSSPQTSLSIKPALLVWPGIQSRNVTQLTSHMDLQATLITQWLSCKTDPELYSNGADLLHLSKDRVIANTMKDGIMVFNKDKSVFIDQYGNFQSYSRQLEAPIVVSSDFPLMIDGVHFIKNFSQNNKTAQ